MIRLDYYLRCKPELGQEAFQAPRLQEYGKLWVKHAETLGARRYGLVHDWPDHLDQVVNLMGVDHAVPGETID